MQPHSSRAVASNVTLFTALDLNTTHTHTLYIHNIHLLWKYVVFLFLSTVTSKRIHVGVAWLSELHDVKGANMQRDVRSVFKG